MQYPNVAYFIRQLSNQIQGYKSTKLNDL